MITISKIAKLANVSVSTASKAFSGSTEVSEITRDRIFNVAKKLGVFKKFYNAKYPKIVIAVVVPEYLSGNYGVLISELQRFLNERDCTVTVTAANFLLDKNETLLDYYANYTNADGIIIVDGNIDVPEDFETPCVFIGNSCSVSMPNVVLNMETAIYDAVKYFGDMGAPSVGFVSESMTANRLELFRRSCGRVYGFCDESCISISESRFEQGGYEATERLINSGKLPRALICGYDNIAYGSMRALSEHGLAVPDDVALISLDNNPSSEYTVPSLSSIDIRCEDRARAAAQIILRKILTLADSDDAIFEAKLILRESSAITPGE